VLTKMWNHTTMQGSSIHKSNVRCRGLPLPSTFYVHNSYVREMLGWATTPSHGSSRRL
jgi:hypothetical protein